MKFQKKCNKHVTTICDKSHVIHGQLQFILINCILDLAILRQASIAPILTKKYEKYRENIFAYRISINLL